MAAYSCLQMCLFLFLHAGGGEQKQQKQQQQKKIDGGFVSSEVAGKELRDRQTDRRESLTMSRLVSSLGKSRRAAAQPRLAASWRQRAHV